MGLGLGLGQGLLVTVETDQHEYSEAEKAKLGVTLAALAGEGAAATDEEEDATVLPVRGPLPPLAGKWASCLRLLSPGTGVTTSLVELTENEAAISACIVSFSQHSDEHFLVVGVARNMVQHQRKICEAAYLDVYRFLAGAVPTGIISKEPGEASDAPQLVLVHRTPIEEAPLCLIPFQGRLLAGLGRTLRLYDLGKKTLLRKCELRGGFPSAVLRMQSNGDRVFVGDMAESLLVVLFDKAANALGIIAEDCVPRCVRVSESASAPRPPQISHFPNPSNPSIPPNSNNNNPTDTSTACVFSITTRLQPATSSATWLCCACLRGATAV